MLNATRCGQIWFRKWRNDFRPLFLALEYEDVLERHANSLGLRRSAVTTIVDYLCSLGKRQSIHFLWRPLLRDPNDEFVLEVAVAARCRYIITHNIRDFVGAERFGVKVIRPGQFLRQLEEPS